jgi:hypothetical protein
MGLRSAFDHSIAYGRTGRSGQVQEKALFMNTCRWAGRRWGHAQHFFLLECMVLLNTSWRGGVPDNIYIYISHGPPGIPCDWTLAVRLDPGRAIGPWPCDWTLAVRLDPGRAIGPWPCDWTLAVRLDPGRATGAPIRGYWSPGTQNLSLGSPGTQNLSLGTPD